MKFGSSADSNAGRMLPPGVKRQLIVLTLLLVVVLVFGIRLFREINRSAERSAAVGAGSLSMPGPPSPGPSPGPAGGSDGVEELLPVEPVPPEPFVESPEVLVHAASSDGASEPSEHATIYFFQKILGSHAASSAPEPVTDLRREPVWERLLEQPNEYRGKLVEVWGFVVSTEDGRRPLHMRGLSFPNPSGRDRAFYSYLYGTDDKFYLVATMKPRPEIAHRQRVGLRAYFCHLYTGDVLVGGELRKGTIPYLVGEDYELVDVASSPGVDVGPYLPIVVVLPLILVIVIGWVGRRARRSYDQRRRKAREELRQERKAGRN